MAITRRRFLQTSSITLAALGAGGLGSFNAFGASGKIDIAALYDRSGGLDIYGKPILDALTLAVEEINVGGGLLGQEVNMIQYDTQSNMQQYAQYAQQAALKDKVSFVTGGITSASREVIRPVLGRFKTLYWYGCNYEGGVCDRNYFASGVTPGQTVAKLVPHALEKWGKKIYILAADYNYGQIVSTWVKKFATENGGTTVGLDFFPLDATNFTATISKIQEAKPDMIFSALVGGAHMSFYRQWAAAGMSGKIPIASTTFGNGNEHIVLSPEESNGILIAQNYIQELQTPQNLEFVGKFHKRFGSDYPYISELAMGNYQGLMLWAEAVRRAQSVDREKVISALEGGISLELPSGLVTVDSTTHHCTLDIHLAEVKNKGLSVVQSFAQQPPSDTSSVCNLKTNPRDTKQYTVQG